MITRQALAAFSIAMLCMVLVVILFVVAIIRVNGVQTNEQRSLIVRANHLTLLCSKINEDSARVSVSPLDCRVLVGQTKRGSVR